MTVRSRRRCSRPIAILLLIPLLGGCGGLLSAPPERQLYRLTPTFAFAAPLPHVAAQLVVAMPTAPAGLATERIALSRAPVTLDYFADAQWADRLPFLVQTALLDGFEKSAAIPSVGPESLGLRADFMLDTTIGDFEAVYDSPGGPPRIVVKLHAMLVSIPEHRIVAQMSVSREASAAANSVPEIVAAFDQALGGAVAEVVTWTAGHRLLSERRAAVISRTRFVHVVGSEIL
jgi:cholesterol transport system auxiliary component